MIRIKRSECPPRLRRTYKADQYAHKEVVKALWCMQKRKCCYCNMDIPLKGHGKEVEHFHPQSVFPGKRNEWENLLLACPTCNGHKGNRFAVIQVVDGKKKVVCLSTPSGDPPAILDPSSPNQDPEDHLTYILDDKSFSCGQVIPRDRSMLGKTTLAVTGIDSSSFARERFERYEDVLRRSYSIIMKAHRKGDHDTRDVELRSFAGYLKPNEPFAGLAREFARHKKMDEHFNLAIPGRETEKT